jgi:hypothetical protein
MTLAEYLEPELARRICAVMPGFDPGAYLVLRVITHTPDGISQVEDTDSRATAARISLERQIVAAQVERRPAAVPPPAPARQRAGFGAPKRSETRPWPRGKNGLRYLVLKLIGGSRKPNVEFSDLQGRVGSATPQQIYMELRAMSDDKWLERTGAKMHYRYSITEVGRKALEWEG